MTADKINTTNANVNAMLLNGAVRTRVRSLIKDFSSLPQIFRRLTKQNKLARFLKTQGTRFTLTSLAIVKVRAATASCYMQKKTTIGSPQRCGSAKRSWGTLLNNEINTCEMQCIQRNKLTKHFVYRASGVLEAYIRHCGIIKAQIMVLHAKRLFCFSLEFRQRYKHAENKRSMQS